LNRSIDTSARANVVLAVATTVVLRSVFSRSAPIRFTSPVATMLMLLTAVDEGLGGFFFWLVPSAADGFDGDKVAAHQAAFRAEFDVPSDYDPVGAVAIGHRPDDLPPQNPQTADRRRGLDVVVHRGQWDRH
jgi:hypothetical protein